MSDLPLRPPAPIKTPCIKVCVIDGETGLCMGCYRELTEVAAWQKLSEEDRARIMTELPPAGSASAPKNWRCSAKPGPVHRLQTPVAVTCPFNKAENGRATPGWRGCRV
jgi:predicted Fe-S protein YdhL (DUF1289 family)